MKKSAVTTRFTRRNFLAATGAAIALLRIIPRSAQGGDARPAPSGRITHGVVGCGGMGKGNTDGFLNISDCQVVAACDVDRRHLDETINKINTHYKNKDCKGYHDYRELMARKDIDAVMLALPDHWQALGAVEAAAHNN